MAKKKKTAAEWFAEFPEWGEKAMANTVAHDEIFLHLRWPDAYCAVAASFLHEDAPEGGFFWAKILDDLEPKP